MCPQEQVDSQKILCASRVGLWKVEHENGQVVRLYADAMMDELLGITGPVTPEERQAFFKERIHPADRELFQEYSVRQKEVQTEIVYRYLHPTRGELFVRCSGGRDWSDTEHLSVIGTHQDITDSMRLEQEKLAEMRLAEQNLSLRKVQKQQENYYEELLNLQSCGLLAYTIPRHKVIHMNAEALRIYGVRDIAEGQKRLAEILSRVYYPDPETIVKLVGLRESDSSVDYECVINHGSPKQCHVMAKTKSIRMPNGERAVITTFVDVSEMVMLRDALNKAEEGSRAKSAFLYAMSHDLRTPMNAIIGYANLIESHWGQEGPSWDYLQKLKLSSQFLLGLIGNVLEVSRIESGKETLHEAPWDLNQLSRVLDLVKSDVARNQLHLHYDADLPSPYVCCDAVKVQEILMNFLSNAVKYTPAGGEITVTVREKPLEQEDRVELQIAVQDTGIGIAKEYIPHLFEAFSREKSSEESGILGTGLGLRIVKTFVELMKGSVTVESEPGCGSCFTAVLPLERTDAPDAEARTKPSGQKGSLEGKRVLLAEDNALNAEIASTILTEAGVRVDTARDGAQAVQMLQNAPVGTYDLILMDVQMPVMNGYEATRAIRALPDCRAKTTIIAMTANAFAEDQQAALDAGMDGYATKPMEPEKLLRLIANAAPRK